MTFTNSKEKIIPKYKFLTRCLKRMEKSCWFLGDYGHFVGRTKKLTIYEMGSLDAVWYKTGCMTCWFQWVLWLPPLPLPIKFADMFPWKLLTIVFTPQHRGHQIFKTIFKGRNVLFIQYHFLIRFILALHFLIPFPISIFFLY